MTTPSLPEQFPTGTLFALIDGIPVTESPEGEMLGWDSVPPRRILRGAMKGTAIAVSEESFRALVRSY